MSPVLALLVGLILGFAAGVRVARHLLEASRRPVARDIMREVPALSVGVLRGTDARTASYAAPPPHPNPPTRCPAPRAANPRSPCACARPSLASDGCCNACGRPM